MSDCIEIAMQSFGMLQKVTYKRQRNKGIN